MNSVLLESSPLPPSSDLKTQLGLRIPTPTAGSATVPRTTDGPRALSFFSVARTPPHPPILSRFPPVPPHPAPAGDSGGGPPSSRFLWAPHVPSACSCPGHVRAPTCSSPLLSLVDPSENPSKGMMDPSPRKKCLPVQEVHGSPEIHPRLFRSLWTPG